MERTDIDRFKSYVTDIIGAFRNDSRVLYWEVIHSANTSAPPQPHHTARRLSPVVAIGCVRRC